MLSVAKKLHEACSFFDAILDRGLTPNIPIYNLFMDAFRKIGHLNMALVLFVELF
uniref:Pentacotripeptide-repeat region of PRORP domain-containing protein n=1 Tax=Physcomitrium patens TaxID=3218 RepID=A0A2K1K3C2_PHYPA|nr:hypothetical protein PHYPA_012739 [Physcomitrium patens]